MKVTRTITNEVKRCTGCPYVESTPEGPICMEMTKKYGMYHDFVFPEGRNKIHPKCPLIQEKIMIKVMGYEQENQGSIDIKEISTTTPIFVKKGEKLIGVLTKETAGWIIRTSNGGGVSGYFLSREKTLSSASEIGPYSFFILN